MKHKVLHLIGSFHRGGSECQAVQLIRLLKQSGRYDVHVACLDPSGGLRDEVERLGFSEIPEYRLTSFYDRNMLRQLRRFATRLRHQRIEIVHTHDFYSNVFGMLSAALARVPVRIAARRETNGWRTPMQKRVERCAYRLAHTVVANAEAVKNQLAAEGVNRNKIVSIYNGLDLDRVTAPPGLDRGEALRMLNLPAGPDPRFVTIVANLRHEVKDHRTFLRAAVVVREAVPEARFVIAGEGELTGTMRSVAGELGIERDVFFVGRCERVAELLAVSDVCVLSSQGEGFSNAILEYMGAGRPVVATDVGGAREAVLQGETGYLVRAGNHTAMASRIIALLTNPVHAHLMGEMGRRVAERKFSCAAQLAAVEALYDGLLARYNRQLAPKLPAERARARS